MLPPTLLVILQSGGGSVDVEPPGQTQGQLFLGLLVAAALLIGLLVAYRRTRYAGLPGDRARHKATLLGNLRDQTPETVYIGPQETVSDFRRDIGAAFDRVEARVAGEDADHDPDRISIREGVGIVAGTLKDEALTRLPDVPRLALRLGSLAITVLVLGFMAVSTELIVRTLLMDAGVPSSQEAAQDTVWATNEFITGALDILALFPGADILFSLGLTAVLILGPILYEHYYVIAAALAAAAALIVAFDRLVPSSLDREAFRHDRSLARQSLGVVAALWAAGVLPSALGQEIGVQTAAGHTVDVPTIGTAVGVLAVVAVFCLAVYRALLALVERVLLVIDLAGEGEPLAVLGYLLVRYVAVGVALIAAPLIPIYAVVILFGGALLDIIGALFAADPLVQVGVLLALAGGWIALGRVVPEAQRDLRTALSETTARNAVRVAVFQRGAILGAMILSGGFLWALFRSPLIAGVGAVLIGGIVWTGLSLVDRATYRARLWDSADIRKGVLVKCFWIRDDDGDRHHVAFVERGRQTHRLATDDFDQLLGDIVLVAERLQAAEPVPTTVSGRGGQDRLEDGFVDGAESERLREEIRKTIRQTFGPRRRTTVADLRRACKAYHQPLWQREVEHRLKTGAVSVRRIDGGELWSDDEATLTLDRDAWPARGERPDAGSWGRMA